MKEVPNYWKVTKQIDENYLYLEVFSFFLGNFFMKITVKSMTPYKFVVQSQRPWAQKAQDIGSWYDILYTVGVAAVLFNAFSLVFTSSFMDKQVYKSSDHVNQTYWDFVYTTANATMYFPNFECDPDVMASRNWTSQDECLPEFCYYRVRTVYKIRFSKNFFPKSDWKGFWSGHKSST